MHQEGFLFNAFVLLFNPHVDVLNEPPDPCQVVLSILFNVIVSGLLHKVRLETFVGASLPKTVRVLDMNNFVSHSVADVHGAVKCLYAVNVGELVKRQGPA